MCRRCAPASSRRPRGAPRRSRAGCGSGSAAVSYTHLTILHAHGLDAVLEIGLDTVLVSGISVNDVPTLGHLLTPSGLRRAREMCIRDSYEPTHLLRLLRIRQLASLGFSLEQIDPMLQDLDAERAEGDERRGESDRLLDDLDRQLQEQITQLERQRELIVRIRSCLLYTSWKRWPRTDPSTRSCERRSYRFAAGACWTCP